MTESQRYRVLPGPEDGTRRFLDRDTFEPVVVPVAGQDPPVGDLRPGYLVEADLDWHTAEPRVASVTVHRPTLFAFAADVDPMFEVARDTWQDAVAAGEAMNSRVTRTTDGEPNGVVYVFADADPGVRLAEFRSGARPLDPLVDRANEDEPPAPREVFVLRPADGEYVAVTIAFRKGGQFATTLRETYDAPAPAEPLG